MAPKRRSPSPTPSSAPSTPKKGKAAPASWTEQEDQHLLLALLVSDGNMPVLNDQKRAAMTLVSKRSEEAVKHRWKKVLRPALQKVIDEIENASKSKNIDAA
ncbi:Myb-like domain [Ceraceosorus bombacis]|uniref:Myb-like domain n=1 Tax=Ceraceosorus bombacis TaxID=401625 RepID=A0A0P1BGF6_9BASI|nr:Myb-like domain [Ceraceosorus bombacis]